jgi:hypothetical protein
MLLRTYGAPLSVWCRLKTADGKTFSPAVRYDADERALLALRASAPPLTSTDPLEAANARIRELEERASTPSSASVVPGNPFDGAKQIFELFRASRDMFGGVGGGGGGVTAERAVELAMQVGELKSKAPRGALHALNELAPLILPGLGRILDTVGEVNATRRTQVEANAVLSHAQAQHIAAQAELVRARAAAMPPAPREPPKATVKPAPRAEKPSPLTRGRVAAKAARSDAAHRHMADAAHRHMADVAAAIVEDDKASA